MKKSLLALAVIGAFTGSAFAADSSVQLYGIIDMGVAHYTGVQPVNPNNPSSTASFTALQSGIQSPSRIGLKGKEDLGGGLSAIFNVETGFCAAGTNVTGGTPSTDPAKSYKDNNSGGYCSGGGFMQRQAYVGLTGNFGTVVGGRLYNPAYNNQAAIDPFGYGLTGSIGNTSLLQNNLASLGYKNISLTRADQTLAYITPNFSGFNATLAYTFNVGGATDPITTNGSTSRAYWLSGNYNNGPITAGVDYSQISNMQNFDTLVGGDPSAPNPDGTHGVPFKTGAKAKMYDIFGGYDFGIAKITGLYSELRVDGQKNKQTQWMLGATVPVGPGAVLASYSVYTNGMTSPYPKAKQVAIGYTYSLSKRTNLYTSYSHISNSNGAAIVANSNASTNLGAPNTSSNGFAFGIRHKF